jgi:hypothetical protein
MSKRRADKQLTDRDRPEDDNEDEEMPQDDVNLTGSWQENGTASEATMANRKIIKAVRRGPKTIDYENSSESKPSSSSIEIIKPTEEKKEEKIEEKIEEKKEEVPKPAPFAFAPVASKSPFTFNFGGGDSAVKWPSFQPTPLPTFSPPNLPSFNLGTTTTGGKFEISWPTFPAANFNFDVKKPEASEKPAAITTPTIPNESPIKISNLDSLPDLGKNAVQTKAGRDSLGTPGKTFGENIEAPHSPVLNNPSTKIEETITPPNIEKQENLITGEEDEDIILKAKTKLLQFESGVWANKGIGMAKLMKHKETSKSRLVMRAEAGTVLLNMPIIPNMEVTFHQQRNLKFVGLNAVGEAPFKAGTFSLCFSVASEKDEMYKHLNNAIASATTSSEKKEEEKK